MTQLSMAERKARLVEQLKTQQEGGANRARTGGDNASYPFWNIKENEIATIRFLPDADENNPYFWKKREVIKLPFEGTINGDKNTNEQVSVTVPCMHMFGETCPIQAHTKPWWGTDQEDIAKIYWKKQSFIYQGFVVNSPLVEKEVPANPIRRFVINKSIHAIIEQTIVDPDFDFPVDYDLGCDFRLTATRNGKYASYSTSTWARKARSLSQEERDAVEEYGLFNLSDFTGQKPTAEGVKIIEEMFLDSLAGNPYDFDKYGDFYKPYGIGASNSSSSEDSNEDAAPAKTASAPKVTAPKTVAPAASEEASDEAASGGTDAKSILARLRKQQS